MENKSPNFIRLRDVNPDDPSSWMGSIILTFDMDWASDEVLHYTLDILEKSEKPATIFVTHDTSVLSRIRRNASWEIGMHPNFTPPSKSALELDNYVDNVLSEISEIVPEAVSLRSHGVLTAGRWLWKYASAGIKYLSNTSRFGMSSVPSYEVNGLIECPVYFGDNAQLVVERDRRIPPIPLPDLRKVGDSDLRVLVFHPIHVALNTEIYDRYERSRHAHSDWQQLSEHRNKTNKGAEYWLREVLNL